MGRRKKRARGGKSGGQGARVGTVERKGGPQQLVAEAGTLAGTMAREAGGRRSQSVDACPEALRQVGMEVLRKDLDPAAWAQALVESRGSRDDAMASYAKFRLQALVEEQGERQGKKVHLEERRRQSFRDFREVPVMPPEEAPGQRLHGFMDALFWHFVAMVGMLGCLLAAGLLWPSLKLNLGWQVVLLVVAGMQLIPLLGWYAGRGVRGAVSYAQAAQMAACLAMIGSMWFGLKLVQKPPREAGLLMAGGAAVEETGAISSIPGGGEATATGPEAAEPGNLASTEEE